MISYSYRIRDDVLHFRGVILKNVSSTNGFNFSDKDCWIDDFMTNDILKDMLMAISEADIIIMCLSPEYAKSDNCMFEAQLSKALRNFWFRSYSPASFLSTTNIWRISLIKHAPHYLDRTSSRTQHPASLTSFWPKWRIPNGQKIHTKHSSPNSFNSMTSSLVALRQC